MATQPTTGLTYDDLQRFPDDRLRREIIDGELFVTAAPVSRHQRVVVRLVFELHSYAKVYGGEVYPAPTDVYFSHTTVVEPDVVFIRPEHVDRTEERFIRSAPDLVVEISSPSTRRVDLGRKLALYERERVPEYWYVDLDAERIEVRRLEGDRYPRATLLTPASHLESPILPGFSVAVEEILGSAR